MLFIHKLYPSPITRLTKTILKLVDDTLGALPPTGTVADIALIQEPSKHLAAMWKMAVESGSKDDLIELQKEAPELLNKVYLKATKDYLLGEIQTRIDSK